MTSTSPIGPAAPVLPAPAAPPAATYTVVVRDYPGDFGLEIEVPVLEDRRLRLKKEIRKAAGIGTPFKFTLEDAINAAERHLFIRKKSGRYRSNPPDLVEEFLNLLRWEVKTFWMVNPAGNWYGETEDPKIQVTSEHPRRSGEMLGEGIAVLFAERRLGIQRQKMFFYEAKNNAARPDFVFPLRVKPLLGIVMPGRHLYGLEARSRNGIQSISKIDRKKLRRKKGLAKPKKGTAPPALSPVSGVLAIYSSYGKPSPRLKTVRTQLIVGDPEDDPVRVNNVQMAEVLAIHYIGVTSRIGLWDELKMLEAAYEELRQGKMPRLPHPSTRKVKQVQRGTRKTLGRETYRGRTFSSILAALHSGQLTQAEAASRVQRGDNGEFIFHGLNVRTIDLIRSLDFARLEEFFDDNAKTGHAGATVGSDGSIMMKIQPDEQDLAEIRRQVTKPKPGTDGVDIDLSEE